MRKMDRVGLARDLPRQYTFWSYSLKATPTRLAVLDVVVRSTAPMSIVEITKKIGDENIGLATVYRAVKVLKKGKIIRKSKVQTRPALYELVKY